MVCLNSSNVSAAGFAGLLTMESSYGFCKTGRPVLTCQMVQNQLIGLVRSPSDFSMFKGVWGAATLSGGLPCDGRSFRTLLPLYPFSSVPVASVPVASVPVASVPSYVKRTRALIVRLASAANCFRLGYFQFSYFSWASFILSFW